MSVITDFANNSQVIEVTEASSPNQIENEETRQLQIVNDVQKESLWENTFVNKEEISASVQRLERPDNIKAIWGERVLCPYGLQEEVCSSRVGEHDDDFHWTVSFPGFETYTVGDFVVLNTTDSNYSISKVLALWRCSSSRRNYASILRYENAYTVLTEGDPHELLLAKNRQPEKVELKVLRRTVRVLDLSGQNLPSTLNTTEADFYTYRFINTDGKTTTTVVPDSFIILKKICDVPDKVKVKKRRESKKKKNFESLDATGKVNNKRIKKSGSSIPLSALQLRTQNTTVLDLINSMSSCEEVPEEVITTLGDVPYNKLKQTKKFLLSLLKVLDQMNIPSEV